MAQECSELNNLQQKCFTKLIPRVPIYFYINRPMYDFYSFAEIFDIDISARIWKLIHTDSTNFINIKVPNSNNWHLVFDGVAMGYLLRSSILKQMNQLELEEAISNI